MAIKEANMAARTLLVQVLQEDIDEGEAKHTEKCALARALRRTAGAHRAGIGNVSASYTVDRGWRLDHRSLVLSKTAMTFVRRFDRGLPTKPATFRLVYRDQKPYGTK